MTLARKRSCMLSAPSSTPLSSPTRSWLILCASISCTASTASSSGEIGGGEAMPLEERDGECVAERERGGGARGGCQVERTGLLRHARVEMHVRLARERRARVAGHGDQLGAAALDQRHDGEQLVARA